MSYTFCRVIWGWIFKDPKAKKWVGDHDDVFTYYFKILMHAFLVCIDCNKLRFSCTLGWTRSSGTSRATRTNWRTEETKWHWVSERRSGEWETTSTCSLHWFGSSVLTACLLQRFYYFFLEVLTMSGLSTFPLVDGKPVTLAQLLPLVE